MSRRKVNKKSRCIKHNCDLFSESPYYQTKLKQYLLLLQLFPQLHPAIVQNFYERCHRNVDRTIDNILFYSRYCYYLETTRKQKYLEQQSQTFGTVSTTVQNSETVNENHPRSTLNGNFNSLRGQSDVPKSAEEISSLLDNICSYLNLSEQDLNDYSYSSSSTNNNNNSSSISEYNSSYTNEYSVESTNTKNYKPEQKFADSSVNCNVNDQYSNNSNNWNLALQNNHAQNFFSAYSSCILNSENNASCS